MSNYRLVIQYDGRRYRGWQRQEEEQDTIQRRIEKVIRRQYGMDIRIQGAGRTDAGVHARGQVANFHMAGEVPVEEIRDKLNEYLPEDIRIMAVERAGDRFHSRLNATGKIVICFEGNGFLYHMVRILTGTLVEIGTGERVPESIQEILMTGERCLAGVTAPAAGLCLVEVQYD